MAMVDVLVPTNWLHHDPAYLQQLADEEFALQLAREQDDEGYGVPYDDNAIQSVLSQYDAPHHQAEVEEFVEFAISHAPTEVEETPLDDFVGARPLERLAPKEGAKCSLCGCLCGSGSTRWVGVGKYEGVEDNLCERRECYMRLAGQQICRFADPKNFEKFYCRRTEAGLYLREDASCVHNGTTYMIGGSRPWKQGESWL